MLWQPTRNILQPNQHWRRPQAVAAVATTTLDPATVTFDITLSNGNLTATGGDPKSRARSVNGYTTGKFYCEAVAATTSTYGSIIGLVDSDDVGGGAYSAAAFGDTVNSVGVWQGDAIIYGNVNQNLGNLGSTYGAGDVISMAADIGGARLWFRKNGGNWNNSGSADPATGVGGANVSFLNNTRNAGCCSPGSAVTFNFGSSAYAYAPPSGFGNW